MLFWGCEKRFQWNPVDSAATSAKKNMAGFGFFGLQSRSGHVEGSSQLAYSWGFLSLFDCLKHRGVVNSNEKNALNMVVFHRGLYYPLWEGFIINHCKDHYTIKNQIFFLGFRWVPFWKCWELWWFLGQFFLLMCMCNFFSGLCWCNHYIWIPLGMTPERRACFSIFFGTGILILDPIWFEIHFSGRVLFLP